MDHSKILITGGTGRLGKACKKIFPEALYPGTIDMDIRNSESVRIYMELMKPEIIIHLAAVASIPKCENDKPGAWNTNVIGTRNILEVARNTGVSKFLYLQTACIFPGMDDEVYYEDSIPDPKHYYGITKLVAEESVRAAYKENFQTLVVRTNFTTMPWEYPKAFTDRYGTYLFAQGVASGLLEILESNWTQPVLHLCGDRKMSMYEYAITGGSNVEPTTLADYSGIALTKNMSLGTHFWKTYQLEASSYID